MSLFSQNYDSELKKQLYDAKNYKDSSQIIKNYVKENKDTDPQKAFALLKASGKLIQNTSDHQIWADYFLDTGDIYFRYLEIDKAVENYIKSYDYYQSANSAKK